MKAWIIAYVALASVSSFARCPDLAEKAQRVAQAIAELEHGPAEIAKPVRERSFGVYQFSMAGMRSGGDFAGSSTYRIEISDSPQCSLMSVVNEGGLE